jgi:transmembrane sensor
MDDLLIKYLLKEITPAETAQVEQWISADAENRKRYEQLKATWEISGRNTLRVVPDAQQALQRLKRKLEAAGTGVTGKQTGSAASVKGSYRTMRAWRAAAIFAGIACLGMVMYFILTPTTKIDSPLTKASSPAPSVEPVAAKPVAIAMQTDMAGNNIRLDTLPDGSIVTLNKHAAISYLPGFKGDTRIVELRGDAFFSVAHNPSKPFIVHVNDIKVKVVGTSFSIIGGAGRTEVVVKTGIVQVIAGMDSLKLYAGDEMLVLKTGKGITINKKSVHQQEPGKQVLPDIVTQGKNRHNGPDSAIEPQKQTARDIIAHITMLKIIIDKDHLSWFALDNRHFVVDGKVIADSIHKIFRLKYIRPDGAGYYYGPNQVRGAGYCFEKSDLY